MSLYKKEFVFWERILTEHFGEVLYLLLLALE